MKNILVMLVTGLSVICGGLHATADAKDDDPHGTPAIPPDLAPWVPWVMTELGDATCPELNGVRSCAWPGQLDLDLDKEGGEFTERVVMSARSWHILPGQRGAWPTEVSVDGRAWPVLERDERPAIELTTGSHEIRGKFVWSQVPETLHVGAHTAFLSLLLSGQPVPLVKRDAGNIWLKGLATEVDPSGAPEHVEMQVFRQLRDGVPLQVETLIALQVSGRSRELAFPAPLLAGTVPLSVSGDLAVAVEPTGTLRVQLVPGRHELRLVARTQGVPSVLKNQPRPAPWPEREIWTWHPDAPLRSVEVRGAPSVDTSRTELPPDWRNDSAYVMGPADALELTTTRRAQEQVPENRIQLEREYWLDEDASHFTVRDTLTGEVHQRWRLNLEQGELGQVALAGEGQVITLTDQSPGARRGVEVRDHQLSLVAVSRVPRSHELPAVGWSEDVDRLATTIRLPPGWDLFAATGVDDASDTWLSRWDLFSVFYVLVMTLAVAKLIHPKAGLVAAGALVLSHGELDSPEYVWLPLLVFAALLILVEKGRFQRLLRLGFYGTSVMLWIMFVAFAVTQVRAALYPHLDGRWSEAFEFPELTEKPAAAPVSPPMTDAEDMAAEAEAPKDGQADRDQSAAPSMAAPKKLERALLGTVGRGAGALDSSPQAYGRGLHKQLKPDAVVQSGPGIPETAGHSWQLNWSGPVAKDHRLSLYLISPNVNRLLTALRLVLLGTLGWLIWRRVHLPNPGRNNTAPSPRSAAAAAIVLLGLGLFPTEALADHPSDSRLSQLKERLSKPPSCTPSCLSVSELDIQIAEELILRAKVHVAASSAYKLPGPATALSSVRLRLADRPLNAVRLEADGSYYALLEPGVHEVELSARLTSDRVTLDVGTPPQQVRIAKDGWSVSGVNELGRVEGGTLTLQRTVDRAPTEAGSTQEGPKSQVAVPPFFSIRRSIHLFVTGQVLTRIERLSDASHPEVVQVPLLPGERLTTAGVEVRNGVAIVPFPSETKSQLLSSTLTLPAADRPLELSLTTPATGASTEVWELECGVVWHCVTHGVTPTAHLSEGHSAWTFHPWPGEKLSVMATSPSPAPGAFLTVQHATLSLNPGVRLTRSELNMAVQTSRAVVHTVTIPADAKLDTVLVDEVAQAVKSEAGRVRISLAPGLRRVRVSWQQNRGLSVLFRAPNVDVGAAGVNFRTVLDLPEKRWLLLAGGPSQGPAILVWGYLVLIVCAAVVLARLPWSPLKMVQWLLLGLGLTQIPSGAALFVAGWFFAIGSRRSWPTWGRFRHNLMQLGLIFYTLAFLTTLTVAVYEGLVSSPDMDVVGAGSYGTHLSWISDRSTGRFAPVWCLSLSVWIWRIFMLSWALWLSKTLLSWLKWAWGELNQGRFWASKPQKQVEVRSQGETPAEQMSEPDPSVGS